MNVIYRVHGAGGFYMETQSQDQAFRAARQEAAASGQMTLVSFNWNGRQQFNIKHIRLIAIRYSLDPQQVWDIFLFPESNEGQES